MLCGSLVLVSQIMSSQRWDNRSYSLAGNDITACDSRVLIEYDEVFSGSPLSTSGLHTASDERPRRRLLDLPAF